MKRRIGLVVLAAIGWNAALEAQSLSVYQEGADALRRGDPQAAIALVAPVLDLDPKDLRALTLQGMALTAQRKTEEANECYRRALAVNGNYVPALRNLAMNEMAMGRPEAARKSFVRLLAITPADPVAHLALGEIYHAEGRYSDAVRHFDQSERLYLRDGAHVLAFADSCLRTAKGARAEEALRQFPPTAEPRQHLEAGLLLTRLENYEAAAREFERVGSAAPHAYTAGYNLALARLKSGQHEAAIRAAEEVIASGHRTAEIHNVLAHAYDQAGRTKDAYEALRSATEIDPKDETNYLDLIAICLNRNNLDLAMQIADVGVKRLPESERLHLQKGIVWAMKGDFAVAREVFTDAIERAPEQGLPKVALGLVLLQMDEPGAAAKTLRASRARPEDAYLLNWFLAEALSRTASEVGSAEDIEAVQALRKAVRQKPDLPQPRVLLGKLLLRRGDADGAVEQLQRALRMDPANTAATYQLAVAYRKKGLTKRAQELFDKVGKAKTEEREQLTREGFQAIIREGTR